MKKMLLVHILVVCTLFEACTQVSVPPYQQFSGFNGDTAAYLKYNFEGRKDYYSGKSIEVLLNDLEIQIKCMYPTTNAPKNDGICKGLLVSFEDQFNTESKTSNGSKLCLMDIDFLSEISLDSVYAMVRALDRNEWGPTFQNYFAPKIISTLRVYVNPSFTNR